MIDFILASHGPLADALVTSCNMLCNANENIYACCLNENDSAESLGNQIRACIHEERETILFVDLLGGTPSNQGLLLLQDFPKLHIVTGMNIVMILEAILLREQMDCNMLIQKIIDSSRNSINEIILP